MAGGHLQDRDIYSNGGSPTAATSSVIAVAALAAHEGRSVGTVDFPSAFLNCDMPEGSEKVYRIKSNEVELRWIATQDMIADILTKPIQRSKFKELRALLPNWNDEVPDEDTCVELTTPCEDVESKSKQTSTVDCFMA